MGKGLSGRKARATQRGRPHREKTGHTAPAAPKQGQGEQGEGRGGGTGRGRGLMHRLLGAVHEATVQLRELPVGDVAGALLQVLETERDHRSGPTRAGGGRAPCPPAASPQALTVSRSRRKRMLGTR